MTETFPGYFLEDGKSYPNFNPSLKRYSPMAILLADWYKFHHYEMYPEWVTQVWSNWTARSSRVAGQTTVKLVGLQYFIKEYLIRRFNEDFFQLPLSIVLKEYRDVLKGSLGIENPRTEHIEWLHRLGYLPIEIWSIPEGFSTPLNVPQLVITNTRPEAFWLVNYIETMMSMVLWKPSTSATTASRFRAIGEKYAKLAGETDLTFVDYQFHDFSMRGMSGLEDAVLSGIGHLTSFTGTDSVPAIIAARDYYNAGLNCGTSVFASEHSIQCAGGEDQEQETFRRLIVDIYPKGIVSIVSDTWDLWHVCTVIVPALKDIILKRDGKLIIRPDSGDPVKIILGDPDSPDPRVQKGVIRLLAEALGTTAGPGGLMINKAGAIYGDSINEERAEAILAGLVAMGFSPYNMVFGIGSFTYEWRTRDTYGFAMKATAVRKGDRNQPGLNGTIIPIFKCPVTDDPLTPKKSHKGIPAVYREDLDRDEQPTYYVYENATEHQLAHCEFRKVFSDGKLLIDEDFDTIRKRARG